MATPDAGVGSVTLTLALRRAARDAGHARPLDAHLKPVRAGQAQLVRHITLRHISITFAVDHSGKRQSGNLAKRSGNGDANRYRALERLAGNRVVIDRFADQPVGRGADLANLVRIFADVAESMRHGDNPGAHF
jgi:hypothetical protein